LSSRDLGELKPVLELVNELKNQGVTGVAVARSFLLTPKFGKESDLWVQLGQESVSRKGRILQIYSAKKSAVGYLLPFGKGTVELILRDLNDDVVQARRTNGWMGDQA
jgi:hypothetical protein